MKTYDFVFLGSGLSTRMVLYYLLQNPQWQTKQIAVVEAKQSIPNKTWSFWAHEEHPWKSIVAYRWNKLRVRNSQLSLEFQLKNCSYQTIFSKDYYAYTDSFFQQFNNIEWIFDTFHQLHEYEDHVCIQTQNHTLTAKWVFNSIFRKDQLKKTPHTFLIQHFVGWVIRTTNPFFLPSMVDFMDFSLEQCGNTRFMYVLPFSDTEGLVEYTLFSEHTIPYHEYTNAIKRYLEDKGLNIRDYTIVDTEMGQIPMSDYPFHQHNSQRVLHIGTAGGWTKASSGYTFFFADQYAKKLVCYLSSSNHTLKKFSIRSRFDLYDAILLQVMKDHNQKGSEIFMQLFQKIGGMLMLKFLSNQTHFFQEARIMLATPVVLFTIAWVKVILRNCIRGLHGLIYNKSAR